MVPSKSNSEGITTETVLELTFPDSKFSILTIFFPSLAQILKGQKGPAVVAFPTLHFLLLSLYFS